MTLSNACKVSPLHLAVDGSPLIKSLSHSIAYSIALSRVLNNIAVLKHWKMHNIYDCWCHCLFFFFENNCNALNPLYLNEVSALLFMFWKKNHNTDTYTAKTLHDDAKLLCAIFGFTVKIGLTKKIKSKGCHFPCCIYRNNKKKMQNFSEHKSLDNWRMHFK